MKSIEIKIAGKPIKARVGETVINALWNAGIADSIKTGCVCGACTITVRNSKGQMQGTDLACMCPVEEGMEIFPCSVDSVLTVVPELNPTVEKFFLGMTYKYHSDALLFPKNNYLKLNKPFLVVTGVKDSIIESSDAFVKKAKYFGVNITYFRISDMDHYIRLRPDVIKKSFEWLNQVLD